MLTYDDNSGLNTSDITEEEEERSECVVMNNDAESAQNVEEVIEIIDTNA